MQSLMLLIYEVLLSLSVLIISLFLKIVCELYTALSFLFALLLLCDG
jgi:hypothetical protein